MIINFLHSDWHKAISTSQGAHTDPKPYNENNNQNAELTEMQCKSDDKDP